MKKSLFNRGLSCSISHTPSSRKVSVRDITSFLLRPIPRITGLRGDEAGVRAFTLIELLVVVLIIGILSAIALPQYQKAVKKAQATEALLTLKSLSQAQDVYYLENGTYATRLEDLAISVSDTSHYQYRTSGQRNVHAIPLQASLPRFEFYFSQGEIIRWRGKNWCIGLDDFTKSICRSLGPVDVDPGLGEIGSHYVIN